LFYPSLIKGNISKESSTMRAKSESNRICNTAQDITKMYESWFGAGKRSRFKRDVPWT